MTTQREFDIVVYGATGFTGGLVAKYLLTKHPERAGRIALAGRNEAKLEAVRAGLGEHAPSAVDVGLVVASSGDAASLAAMARRTRVVLSTAGPFVEHGPAAVAACVAAGTDWLDITGEPEFVREMVANHATEAEANGALVISCCGFDSIPTDLGVFYALKQLKPQAPVRVSGFMTFDGRISGGTWNSALGAFADVRRTLGRVPKVQAGAGRRVRLSAGKLHRDADLGWVAPMPSIDPEVVLRSAATLDAYGPDFQYSHYFRVGGTAQLALLGAGATGAMALSQTRVTRQLLGKLLPPGQGPSEEVRARSSFEIRVRARCAEKSIVAVVRGGDPGYDETAKMVSEAALALVDDRASLPLAGGVRTTAEAMGDVLLARLIAAGIEFRVLD